LINYRKNNRGEKLALKKETKNTQEYLHKTYINKSKTEIKIIHKNTLFFNFCEKLCFYKFIRNEAKRNFISYTHKLFDRMLSIEYILKTFNTVENLKTLNPNSNLKSIMELSY